MQTYTETSPEVLVTIHVPDSPRTWTPEKVLAQVQSDVEREFYETHPTELQIASAVMNFIYNRRFRVWTGDPVKATKKATKKRRRQSREASRAAVAALLREHPDWKRGRIAEACGLSPSYVGALLRELRGTAVKEATLAAIARRADLGDGDGAEECGANRRRLRQIDGR